MKLEDHVVVSSTGEFSRNAWYLPGRGQPRKTCIFLDGEFYVHLMDAPAIVTGLQDAGLIPPVACLFISHVNGEARHHDYLCNESYARFVAGDIVEWMRNNNPAVPPGEHLLGGTSLSGLQAAYTSMCHPRIFPRTLCQSGSFWWNKEWLAGHVRSLPASEGRYWISVGDQETRSGVAHPPTALFQEVDQITASKGFADAAKEFGQSVHYHLYDGGHESGPWKEELPDALRWLLAQNIDDAP